MNLGRDFQILGVCLGQGSIDELIAVGAYKRICSYLFAFNGNEISQKEGVFPDVDENTLPFLDIQAFMDNLVSNGRKIWFQFSLLGLLFSVWYHNM
ncbi:MAG: hypothetical protein DDT18_01796 [Actinobacteria bacterium]|nr:hypothetical protein [Actinomycetota bacterium]